MYLILDSNTLIKGIKIANIEIKLIQFANVTTLILDGSSGSLQAVLNTVEVLGLKVNTEKTQIVWIGKKRGSEEKLNITELGGNRL